MKNQNNNTNKNMKVFGTIASAPEFRITATGRHLATCLLLTFENEKQEDGSTRRKKVWRNLAAWGKSADFMKEHLTAGKRVGLLCDEKHRGEDTGKTAEYLVTRVIKMMAASIPSIKAGADC